MSWDRLVKALAAAAGAVAGLFGKWNATLTILATVMALDYVSGLIVGSDLIRQLKNRPLGDELLISSAMLRFENDLFLDDISIDDVERELHIKVTPINNDGTMLVNAILGEEGE